MSTRGVPVIVQRVRAKHGKSGRSPLPTARAVVGRDGAIGNTETALGTSWTSARLPTRFNVSRKPPARIDWQFMNRKRSIFEDPKTPNELEEPGKSIRSGIHDEFKTCFHNL